MQYFKLRIVFVICVVYLSELALCSVYISYVGSDENLNCGDCRYSKDYPFMFQVTGPSHDGSSDVLITIQNSNVDISKNYRNKITSSGLESPVFQFLVKNISRQDAGEYRCSQGKLQSCVASLVVVGMPEKAVINSSGPAMLNGNVTLTCSARSTSVPEGHGLKMLYYWKMNGKSVQDSRFSVIDGSLTFKVLKRHDGDTFTCSAEEEGLHSEESDAFTMSVEYKPRKLRFVPYGDVTSVAVGNVLDVICSADCMPRCTTTWLNEKTMTSQDNTMLKIAKVARADQSNYTCTVKNKYGRKSRTLFVDVLYNPIVESVRLRNNVTEHGKLVKAFDSVTINCSIDSHPAPVVKWYTKNMTTPSLTEDLTDRTPVVHVQEGITHHQYSSTYQLSSAQCSDSGLYHCQADNGIDNPVNGVSWELVVYCAPSISSHSSFVQTYAKENEKPVTVKVEIEAFPRPSNYRLYLVNGGQRREATGVDVKPVNVPTAYLIVYELMFRVDLKVGVEMYIFEVENSEGSTSINFNVTLQGPPLKSSQLLAETGSDFISLYWIPGFDGGFSQTFTLAYRKDENEEWVTKILDHQLLDMEEGSGNMTAVVHGFEPATDYDIRLYAENDRGRSESTEIVKVTTLMAPAPVSEANAGKIAGICVAVLLIIVIVAVIVIIFMKRRRKKEPDAENNVEYNKLFLEETRGKADGSPGEEKNKSTEELYAEVKKNPKMDDVDETHPDDAIPAENEEKKPEESEEEVVPLIPEKTYKSEESLPNNNNETPPKQDLTYLELDLSKPTGNTKEPVVHGNEDATQYSAIDFSQTAEPEKPDGEEDGVYENMEVPAADKNK